jgi:hypothetical protein
MEYYLNLGKGSGIGSVIFQIIGSQYILESKNLEAKLIVNICDASYIAKFFINNVLDKDKIKNIFFIDKPRSYFKVSNNYIELLSIREEDLTTNQISNLNIYGYYFTKIGAFERYLYYFDKIWFIKKEYKCTEMIKKKYDICVNLRRGSKEKLEPHLSIHTVSQYIDIIKQLNLESPKIIHTSCTYETFLEFKDLDPSLNINNSIESTCCRGFWITDFETKSEEEVKLFIIDFLKQLKFMEKSTYFIGSSSTNVGYIASFLRRNIMNNDKYNLYHRDDNNTKIECILFKNKWELGING